MCYILSMSAKKTKTTTSTSIKINTALFFIAAIVFACSGVYTVADTVKFNEAMHQYHHISNPDGLCYDESGEGNDRMTDNEYICMSGTENEETDPNQLALYLDGVITDSSDLSNIFITRLMTLVSFFFTVSSFFGGIIYWNHNRYK